MTREPARTGCLAIVLVVLAGAGACNVDQERFCHNGKDDDEDGLPDCEDADCYGKCTESRCWDGLDNDDDGFADCSDDDCWATKACPYTEARVTGGSLRVRMSSQFYLGPFVGSRSRSLTMTGSKLSGTVVVGSHSPTVCRWWASRLELRSFYDAWWSDGGYGSRTASHDLFRDGLRTSGMCDLDGSWWLPAEFDVGLRELSVWSATRREDGPWYLGEVTSSTRRTTTYNGPYSYSYYNYNVGRRRVTWSIPALSTGSPWRTRR